MAQLLIQWDAEPGDGGDGTKEGSEDCMVNRIAMFAINNFGTRKNMSVSGDLSTDGSWILSSASDSDAN